jgi:catechol 2,3-dioxygenase-like lactoylglutathione lyase family enzyme
MLDHVGIEVADLGAGKSFYAAALEPVGIGPLMGSRGAAGFGKQRDGKPFFWIYERGADNGPPGPRPIYQAGYCGAFVLDPDGYNIEAVCHTTPPQD